MSLKIFTTACLIAGVLLFLPWSATFAGIPSQHASKTVKRSFAQRLLVLTGLQVLTLVGAGAGAALIVRKAKNEYRELALDNMKSLLEIAEEEKRKTGHE